MFLQYTLSCTIIHYTMLLGAHSYIRYVLVVYIICRRNLLAPQLTQTDAHSP